MRTEHLVIGASGQVGGHLLAALRASGQAAAGTYSQHPVPGLVQLDVLQPEQIAAVLQTWAPRSIYIPAALTNVDYCETHPAESYAVNVTGLENVARAASRIGARVVYFSSDYVFDGQAGPYDENQAPTPICVYGRHKQAAEDFLTANVPQALIVRTTWVFGWEAQCKNFVCRLLRTLRAGQTQRLPADQLGNPTYAPDLAEAVIQLTAQGAQGIYNVVGRDRLSRYDFARAVARCFGLDENQLIPVSTAQLGQTAPRPLNAGLTVAKVETMLGRPMRGHLAGLQAMYALRETHDA